MQWGAQTFFMIFEVARNVFQTFQGAVTSFTIIENVTPPTVNVDNSLRQNLYEKLRIIKQNRTNIIVGFPPTHHCIIPY